MKSLIPPPFAKTVERRPLGTRSPCKCISTFVSTSLKAKHLSLLVGGGGDSGPACSAALGLRQAAEGPRRTRRLRRAQLTPGPLQPDQPRSADSWEDGRGGAHAEPGFSRPGGRVAVKGLGAKAEGGTIGPGTVRRPESTVGTVLRAREAKKGGRAGNCFVGLSPTNPGRGAPQPGPAKTRRGAQTKRGGSKLSFGTARAVTASSVSQAVGPVAGLGPARRL